MLSKLSLEVVNEAERTIDNRGDLHDGEALEVDLSVSGG